MWHLSSQCSSIPPLYHLIQQTDPSQPTKLMILGTACSVASIIMGEIAERHFNMTQVWSCIVAPCHCCWQVIVWLIVELKWLFSKWKRTTLWVKNSVHVYFLSNPKTGGSQEMAVIVGYWHKFKNNSNEFDDLDFKFFAINLLCVTAISCPSP